MTKATTLVEVRVSALSASHNRLTRLLGSTTVHPYDDPETRAIELGASIFVKANKNMWRASEEFNLSRIGFEDEDGVTGIWDGEKFIMTACLQNFYLNAKFTLCFRWEMAPSVGGIKSSWPGAMVIFLSKPWILRAQVTLHR